MALEDPFFVVKDEVLKALAKTRDLFESWRMGEDGRDLRSAEEQEWAATELRNSLRSIEWDLEDLDDTVQIVEKNPAKFRIDASDVSARKAFIVQTRDEVNQMKERTTADAGRDAATMAGNGGGSSSGTTMTSKYSRVPVESDSPSHVQFSSTRQAVNQQQLLQQQLMTQQDDRLQMMSESVGNLRSVSGQIGNELDEQAVMLDEFGTEIENAETKLDATMRKMAKVLHMANDRRQWMAIGALSSAMVVIILMIFAL